MHRLACTAPLAALLLASPVCAQVITAKPTYLEAPGKLTEAEMKTLFTGRYHEDGVDAAGNAWTVDATADGRLSVNAGAYTDSGRARLDGIRLCVAWRKAWKGEERCFRYAHHGEQLASYGPDGKLDSALTLSR